MLKAVITLALASCFAVVVVIVSSMHGMRSPLTIRRAAALGAFGAMGFGVPIISVLSFGDAVQMDTLLEFLLLNCSVSLLALACFVFDSKNPVSIALAFMCVLSAIALMGIRLLHLLRLPLIQSAC